MEVLLIYPYLNRGTQGSYWDPPLGILYLATYLQNVGIKCQVIDATFMRDWVEFENNLQIHKPDIIGLSFTSSITHLGFKAAAIVRKLWPKAFIVAGGPHPTIMPSHTIENDCIDAIVIGEGEVALNQLVRSISTRGDLANVPNIWYKKDGQVMQNRGGYFISNLDDLPFPNRSFIDMERYITLTHAVPIHVMRGCPFNCYFCQPSQKKIFGSKLRSRSPGNVVAEMLALRKTFPKRNYAFSFQADTITTSKKWILELCREITEHGLQETPWVADSRVDTIDAQVMDAMKQAGCFSIHFGVESGSQKILDFLNKGITVEQSGRAIKLCHKKNIIPQAYIMIGTPTETKEDLEKTCRLIRNIRPNYINISRTTPVPGSGMYDYITQEGISNISGFSDFDYYHNDYPIKLKDLSRDDLDIYHHRIMRIWVKSLITGPSVIIKFLSFLHRFRGYRLFFLNYGMRGLSIGTTGQFFAPVYRLKKKFDAFRGGR